MAKDKTADELLSGRLKRSPSYASELGNCTVAELEDHVRRGQESSDKARKMLKLIKQADRIRTKLKDAGRS